MARPRTKRGAEERQLEPVLARALGRLREQIEEQGITQSELQERTGLSQGHISRALRGTPEVSFSVVVKLALAVPVSLDWLVAAAPAPTQFSPDPDDAPGSSAHPSGPGSIPPRAAGQK